MPLSEHEQRMLDELERQLHAEDPRLASQMAEQPRRAPVDVRRVVLAAAIGIAGLLVILWGVTAHLIVVGVLGALLLGAGLFVLTARGRGGSDAERAPRDAKPRTPRRGGSGASGAFMSRLEQRWDERRDQDR